MPNLPLISAAAVLISTFAPQTPPWLSINANSEQRQPVYLGSTPREISLRKASQHDSITVTSDLKDLAEAKISTLANKLNRVALDVELWIAQNERGQRTWAFARWRKNESEAWAWITEEKAPASSERNGLRAVFFPELYRPWVKKESDEIFKDFMRLRSLYHKPVFGDCVWATEDGANIAAAWLSPEEIYDPENERSSEYEQLLTQETAKDRRLQCWAIPQPSRLDGRPKTWVVRYNHGEFTWPEDIVEELRTDEAKNRATLKGVTAAAKAMAPTLRELRGLDDASFKSFEAAYKKDVEILSGAREAFFPITRAKANFGTHKNSADADNQLLHLVSYLEERYAVMGLETRRHSFTWRGIDQANLIARIPGSRADASRYPVLIADHIDTAFTEDEFDRSGKRVSAAGADDNASGVAGVLRAAEVLKSSRPEYDIWLVHITGEEFPADDLGARRLLSQFLGSGQDIRGLVLMDMIGYRSRNDAVFQISVGESEASMNLGKIALASAFSTVDKSLKPKLRPRFDEHSYLYNTDGVIFSDSGYPVVLFNEHLNYHENLNRRGYHMTTDTTAKMDFFFAASIARVAVRTAAELAGVR